MGDAPPAVVSLLLLLTGDVDTNPGPSCYACGQNFRQSDTPLNCHGPQIAEYDPTNKRDAVARPDLNSLYRGISQPTVDPGPQLPPRRPTPATAVTTRSDQAPGLSPVLLRAA